jgi:hypothetical protein
MAIKVSGITVVDNDRNLNVGILTATSLDVPPQAITFSPTDGSSDNSIDTNIVITYNTDVQKGSGNITLREGNPSSGTVIETIAVSSGTVSISGGAVTINPSDLPTGKDIYVVVDDGAFESTSLESGTKLLDTYNFTTGPITTSSFSPTDGATNVAIDSNIVITFSENITKETTAATKYITLRAGNPSTGTIRQTIDVSTSAVTVSGTQATINPPSDLEYEEDTYVVVDEDSFFNSDGDAASGNAVINTYNFTTESDLPSLGDSFEGGNLICCSSSNYWIVSPSSTIVRRIWDNRADAVTTANSNAACGDWFVPSCAQLKNPGYVCRTYWDAFDSGSIYWSNTEIGSSHAWFVRGTTGCGEALAKTYSSGTVRAFRCVSY